MSEHIAAIPCPFCGMDVSLIRIGAAYRVACRCGAEGPAYHTEDAAIAAWNQRAAPSYHDVEQYYRDDPEPDPQAELVALRALREAAYGAIAYKVDWAGTPSDVIRTLDDALAKCEKASAPTGDEVDNA